MAAPGIEGIKFLDAEGTSKVAARKVEEVRWNELGFFAVFDPMLIDSRFYAGFTWTALAALPISAAAMLAQMTRDVMMLRLGESIGS
jgi:hypothetical protein